MLYLYLYYTIDTNKTKPVLKAKKCGKGGIHKHSFGVLDEWGQIRVDSFCIHFLDFLVRWGVGVGADRY
jgi:hypothetical protein